MARRSVLVVEDLRSNVVVLREVLHAHGYHVLEANTAEEGIRVARDEVPDLILMDIGLPHMDGLVATQLLKDIHETRDIPVVAMTGYATEGDRDRCLAAGCSGYIAKPFRIAELPQQVAQFAGGNQSRKQP